MNKEQQELVGEAYDNYFGNFYKLPNNKKWMKEVFYSDGNSILHVYLREEFINKCKTDPEFSEKWGLKIEERELSFEERWDLSEKYGYRKKGGEIPSETETFNGVNEREEFNSMMNDPVMGTNLPTKLITITYNDKTIESYE
jgi:hypothetical protein